MVESPVSHAQPAPMGVEAGPVPTALSAALGRTHPNPVRSITIFSYHLILDM